MCIDKFYWILDLPYEITIYSERSIWCNDGLVDAVMKLIYAT